MIAALAVATGISPLDLAACEWEVFEEMVRVVAERAKR